MGKAERNRAERARAAIAAQQAAARKAERQRVWMIIGGSIGLVIVVVVAFVIVAMNRHPAKQLATGTITAATAATVTGIPDSELTAVGTGTAVGQAMKPITDKPLTSGGKPELLYIGAEFCPYCAAMRWSTVVALSKFGSWGTLSGIHSAATTPSGQAESFPNTATFTFLHQKYTSQYLTFTPIENEDIKYQQLQQVTAAQQALWKAHEPQGQLGYPYYYFGGKVVQTGPLYDPTVLKGLTWTQIGVQLKNPKSPVAQGVLGAANYQIAAICKMTGDTPVSVCKTTVIQGIESKI